MTALLLVPYEYATRPLPDTLELCPRCKAGLVHRRGPDALPYCARCGADRAGVLYTRKGAPGTPMPALKARRRKVVP